VRYGDVWCSGGIVPLTLSSALDRGEPSETLFPDRVLQIPTEQEVGWASERVSMLLRFRFHPFTGHEGP